MWFIVKCSPSEGSSLTYESSGGKYVSSLYKKVSKPCFAMLLSLLLAKLLASHREALVTNESAIWSMVLSDPSSIMTLACSSVPLNVNLFISSFLWPLIPTFPIKSFNDSQDIYVLFITHNIFYLFLKPPELSC